MGLFGSKKHSIGKTIAELRKEKGWTQIELAEKLQVSDKAVSKWEKDSGAPSVEFFPVLAELFGVSIDYIMTGKKPEPEIITMSKIELCAKNDDVQLFNSLNEDILTGKDENGKTLLDYILKYQSKKIVTALFSKYPVNTIISQSDSYFRFWDIDEVLGLLIRNNLIKELEELEVFSIRFYGDERRTKNGNIVLNIFTPKYRTIFLTDKNVSDDLKIKYFQSCTANQIVDCLNDLVALNDKKQIEILWNIVKSINEKNIARYEERKKEIYPGNQIYARYTDIPGKEYEPIGTSCNYYFFVVAIPVQLIEKLLNNGYADIARQANDFNAQMGKEVLNKEKFAYAKAKADGNVSEKELTVLRFTKNGIIDIDALLQTKDYKLIKEILLNNPIHTVELLYNWLKAGKLRELFRYAVDNNKDKLANAVSQNNVGYITQQILTYWYGQNNINNINANYLKDLFPRPYTYNSMKLQEDLVRVSAYNQSRIANLIQELNNDLVEVLAKLQTAKQKIIDDLSLKIDKEKTVGDLTKDYFETQLAKGNTEIVIIKLCVRLEAILRCDYHYEGDFSEMLTNYCNYKCQNEVAAQYLHKLRKCRNGIVHSEKTNEQMTLDELKFCINFICNLG